VRFNNWLSSVQERLRGSRRRAGARQSRRIECSPRRIEYLEPRTMLTVQVTQIMAGLDNELIITTNAGDDIAVRAATSPSTIVEVLENGVPVVGIPAIDPATLTRLTVIGDDGNNVIDLTAVTGTFFNPNLEIIVDGDDGDDFIRASLDIASTLNGGDGTDVLFGGTQADSLTGGDGQDLLNGGDGDDTLNGGDGGDIINGDAGDDLVNGGSSGDTINGGFGADTLNGQSGTDEINGGTDDDVIDGGSGSDTLDGALGDDSLSGGADADSLLGDVGADTLNGDAGNDSLFGGDDNDLVFGGTDDDLLNGDNGNDIVNGNSGNDTAIGGADDDTVLGGSGGDSLFGDATTVEASTPGNDRIVGHIGNDTILGGLGSDNIDGGGGDDLIQSGDIFLSINNVRIDPEGLAGSTTQATFTVILSSPSALPVTVEYLTSSDGTAVGGTATEGSDYTGVLTPTLLTFQPGETQQTLSISVLGDDVDEPEETFFVNLSNPSGAAISNGSGEGRIIDDDQQMIDIFFALDNTGSFASSVNAIQAAFDQIVLDLQAALPDASLGFGLGRFEGYAGIFGVPTTARPFILNQPIVTSATGQFTQAVAAAFDRESPNGGSSQETVFESLLQIATGTGYDGNQDGNSTGFGQAGLLSNQVSNGTSGDVAAYSTFLPDPSVGTIANPGPVLPPTQPVTGATDGVGFRPGSRRIVLVATDSSVLIHQDDGLPNYTGVGGATVGASVFATGRSGTLDPFGRPINIPGNAGAGIQATIDALVAENIEVIGLGDTSIITPQLRNELEAISLLTGGVNNSPNVLENNIDPTMLTADDIGPGDPLFFEVDDTNGAQLGQSVVNAIVSVIGPAPSVPPPSAVLQDVDDIIVGGTGNDTIVGGVGNDLIDGQAGNDSLEGGGGNDTLISGSGDDILSGGSGQDNVSTGEGDNVVTGGSGSDVLILEPFADGGNTALDTGGADSVEIRGTAGADAFTISQVGGLLRVTTSTASITVSSSVHTVRIAGMDGNDTVTMGSINETRPLALIVDLGDGADTFDGQSSFSNRLPIQVLGQGGDDTISGTSDGDILDGGDGNDVISGDRGDDSIRGGAGNDTVFGELGDDQLLGGDGADSLFGGSGHDLLRGGNDDDRLNGNSGADTLEGELGNDSLLGGSGNDLVRGGTGADSLKGQSGFDTLFGGGGNDTVRGDAGNDVINGGDGDDTISGGYGKDLVTGGEGSDQINGNSGNDTLLGDDGDDSIIGGGGADILLGGDGDDRLSGSGSNADTVAGNEGDDNLINNQAGEIDETFVLADEILALLVDTQL
jgi:Ca2+-binding RTX toxin-like protein